MLPDAAFAAAPVLIPEQLSAQLERLRAAVTG